MMTDRVTDNGPEDFVGRLCEIEESLSKSLYKTFTKKKGEDKSLKDIVCKNCFLTEEGEIKQEFQSYVSNYEECDEGDISVLFLGISPSFNVANAIPFDYFNENEDRSKKGVRHWLKITDEAQSTEEAPDFAKERFWKLMNGEFGTPNLLFKHCMVRNFCPVAFGDKDGNDFSWNKLSKKKASSKLEEECIKSLKLIMDLLGRRSNLKVVVFGEYDTKKRIADAIRSSNCKTWTIEHPALRTMNAENWQNHARTKLREWGIFPIESNNEVDELTNRLEETNLNDDENRQGETGADTDNGTEGSTAQS